MYVLPYRHSESLEFHNNSTARPWGLPGLATRVRARQDEDEDDDDDDDDVDDDDDDDDDDDEDDDFDIFLKPYKEP